jgi:hypothetical protein
MRRYLSTLHKRSKKHKNNFALLVAGGVTLIMFSVWHFVHYGEVPAVAEEPGVRTLPGTVHEVSPLDSLSASVGEGWQGVRAGFTDLMNSLNSVNVEQGYEEMKVNTLDTYGQ